LLFALNLRLAKAEKDGACYHYNTTIPLDCQPKERHGDGVYLRHVKVLYSWNQRCLPPTIVQETNCNDPNLNAGFGGAYVWLVPDWTQSEDQAVFDMHVDHHINEDTNYKSLSIGTPGHFRYLKLKWLNFYESGIAYAPEDHPPPGGIFIPRVKVAPINDVGLLRLAKNLSDSREFGWEKCSSNINEGRSGEYLYLCWNYGECLGADKKTKMSCEMKHLMRG